MPVDVVTDIEIARPRSEVAAFSADPANATQWYRAIRDVTWETPPPLAVGSRVRFRATFLGRMLEYTYEVSEFEPLERLVMGTSDGPFTMQTTYAWTDAGRGTHMSLRNRGEPDGFLRALGAVLEPAMRRANRRDLASLKAVLERGAS